ncbi:hypothetical protein FSP39_024883 [Pinctada imbricata]|uniref:Uncharacterized protein n=1 Tax=Pinctada imbricata TaxID=66713 RepID=A0AA89C2K4_PINIB|nr:hypothetical protein FSP39_024883 [Pinctada imbricata]
MVDVRILTVCLVLLLIIDVMTYTERVQYQFKKYTYKKKRDDKKYKNAKAVCEVRPDCLAMYGANQTMCIRKCVSEFCFKELYGDDPLEEGEIDVRFNSFKGCLAQEKVGNMHNKYSGSRNLPEQDLGY